MSEISDEPTSFLDAEVFNLFPDIQSKSLATHPPRILILHGSLRDKSFSRLLAFEAGRILSADGR